MINKKVVTLLLCFSSVSLWADPDLRCLEIEAPIRIGGNVFDFVAIDDRKLRNDIPMVSLQNSTRSQMTRILKFITNGVILNKHGSAVDFNVHTATSGAPYFFRYIESEDRMDSLLVSLDYNSIILDGDRYYLRYVSTKNCHYRF